MHDWIKLERLERNDLPLPNYATKHASGIDFGICLKRPCYLIEHSEKRKFHITTANNRDYDENDDPNFPPTNVSQLTFLPYETIMLSLGFKMEPSIHSMQLYVRSSTAIKGLMLANNVAIIDHDYRGEIFVILYNRTADNITVTHGQHLVQGVLMPFWQAIIKEAPVDITIRGAGGFGSTGN